MTSQILSCQSGDHSYRMDQTQSLFTKRVMTQGQCTSDKDFFAHETDRVSGARTGHVSRTWGAGSDAGPTLHQITTCLYAVPGCHRHSSCVPRSGVALMFGCYRYLRVALAFLIGLPLVSAD